jgi:hypothetical protein
VVHCDGAQADRHGSVDAIEPAPDATPGDARRRRRITTAVTRPARSALRRGLIAGAACATGIVCVAILGPAGPDAARAAAAGAPAAEVSLATDGPAVPHSFSGLSIEYNELTAYEQAGPLFDRVVALIRPADNSPILLRIGGKSADDTYWNTPTAPGAPPWLTEVGQAWLQQLGALARRDGFHVMLDLNLAVHAPQMAASFARAAVKALPAGALAGLAIGNEPDLYVHQPGLNEERASSTLPTTPTNWIGGYSPAVYRSDYLAYASALAAAVPGVRIAGPEIAAARPGWLQTLSGLGSLRPQVITIHRYAGSDCWPKNSPYYPTTSEILSEPATAGLAAGLTGPLAFARASNVPLRVTEFNSVSCGGNDGVADSFATALWAPDALFEMIRAGVGGVNWHLRPYLLNAPFGLAGHQIVPHPELYGMATFAQMVGPGAHLVNVRLSQSPNLALKAWATRSRTGVRLLLINKGAAAASVLLGTGYPGGTPTLSRLTAPSVTSTTGVTLGGQSIGTDARWHGTAITVPVTAAGGARRVRVPGYSAAMITFPAS